MWPRPPPARVVAVAARRRPARRSPAPAPLTTTSSVAGRPSAAWLSRVPARTPRRWRVRSAGVLAIACSTTVASASGTPRGRRSGGGSLITRRITGSSPSSVARVERGVTVERLVERRRQPVDVGLGGRRFAVEDLGRGVVDRGGDQPALRLVSALDAGDPEVAQLVAVRRAQDVGRLDVAVQHAGAVRCLERPAQPHPELRDLGGAHRPLAHEPVVEGSVGDVRHDQVRSTVGGVPRVVERHDRGMAGERAHRLALAIEPSRSSVSSPVRCRTLTATSRRNAVWWPRYTVAKPPRPITWRPVDPLDLRDGRSVGHFPIVDVRVDAAMRVVRPPRHARGLLTRCVFAPLTTRCAAVRGRLAPARVTRRCRRGRRRATRCPRRGRGGSG